MHFLVQGRQTLFNEILFPNNLGENTSDLIWTHSDGIPERIVLKKLILKKTHTHMRSSTTDDKNHTKLDYFFILETPNRRTGLEKFVVQGRQSLFKNTTYNVGSDLDPNCWTLMVFLTKMF